MRKPEVNLDEFTLKALERSAEPPPMVTLHFAGEVEVLKPLAREEGGIENPDPATGNPFRRPAPNRFSWFQSAVAAAAVLGIMVVIFLSAIFIGISDPGASPEFASAGDLSETAIDHSLIDEPFNTENLTAQDSPLLNDEIVIVRPTLRRRIARRVRIVAYRPRRHLPRPQITTTTFIPTTLIIYPENGEIKSRIEPQIAAVYKKPPTITN